MPNLPENGTPTPGSVQQVVTRTAIENAVVATPAESSKANAGIGPAAGSALAAKSEANTYLGEHALQKATTGTFNTAIGYGALSVATTAVSNTAVGAAALISVTGGGNTAVGEGAGSSITTGEENVFVGWEAGNKAEATMSKSILIGKEAGLTATGNGKLIIANNPTTAIIEGVMSATAANQELAFYGVAPVKRAAHPTTLAEVITILKNIGICE
jgi:hypothetical protein